MPLENAQLLADLKQHISQVWQQRERLKASLEAACDKQRRRELWQTLETLDAQLSTLDTQFKRLWDAQKKG